MNYIEAPIRYDRYTHVPILFLAGGITECPNWQREAALALEAEDLVVLNPRRTNDQDIIAVEQIRWEFDHLRLAGGVLFWFPKETLCPITLFEYGKWLVRDKPLFVGTHPEYARRLDLIEQTKYERPVQKVHDSLLMVLAEAMEWARKKA